MDDISSVPEVKEWVNELLNYLVDELKFEYKSEEDGWMLWRGDDGAVFHVKLGEAGMEVRGLFPDGIHESINLQALNRANRSFATLTFFYQEENEKEILFRFLIPMFMEPEYVQLLIISFNNEYKSAVEILLRGWDSWSAQYT